MELCVYTSSISFAFTASLRTPSLYFIRQANLALQLKAGAFQHTVLIS